jgi:D-ribulokinase
MLFLGIDFGTSGVRAIAINPDDQIVAHTRFEFDPATTATVPAEWQKALWRVIGALDRTVRSQIARIAINGTSGTVMLCNRAAQPITPALMYNDDRARSVLPELAKVSPANSPALSATASLAKALWFYDTLSAPDSAPASAPDLKAVSYLAHQADWLASLLHGQPNISDYHNALKLGYDVKTLAYPSWLTSLPVAAWLPQVRVPGEAIAPILPAVAEQLCLPTTCQICAGTTDSIAAFLASDARQAGEAVTSLGSTLVLKLLSDQPIEHQQFGIYSHRLGDLWLVGGASNTGGAVLNRFFDAQQLAALTPKIDISQPCELDYYPLNAPGERFPINDPDYLPRMTPRPCEDKDFLYGLLDGMARIEAQGYQKLVELGVPFGAPKLQQVYSAGGGAQNEVWRSLRQRRLNVKVVAASQTEAAYGCARLARDGLRAFSRRADRHDDTAYRPRQTGPAR